MRSTWSPTLDDGEPLPSENTLERTAAASAGRPCARSCRRSPSAGVVDGQRPSSASSLDRAKHRRAFPEAETVPMSAQVEKRFMEWMLRDNARPGTAINELELARQFGVATTGIREFLNRFQRFGLIEKRPNAGWVFKGFTTELRARAVRDPRDVRAAVGAGLRGAAARARRSGSSSRRCARSICRCLTEIERALSRLLRSRQPLPSADQLGRAQPLHRRLLRHHHADLPLSLPVEQTGRAAAQRGRDPRAPHLHRGAAQPQRHHDRARLPRPSGSARETLLRSTSEQATEPRSAKAGRKRRIMTIA